jgi:hypothetical protein
MTTEAAMQREVQHEPLHRDGCGSVEADNGPTRGGTGMSTIGGLCIEVAWFANGGEEGKPALGTPETLLWEDLADIITNNRRVGEKDGPNLIPTRLERIPGKPHVVRRKAVAARGRTAVALDVEESKRTGALPPAVGDIVHRIDVLRLAAIVWTTHSHTPVLPRYRVLVPLSSEIGPDLPAVEILAQRLGVEGVIDRSKRGPASLFYVPSAASSDDLDHHEAHVVAGEPYHAALMEKEAGDLLAARQIEADRIAAIAQAEAAARREAKIAAGFDQSDSLIEKLRSHFDLGSVLTGHGYDRQGTKYRHPNSSSGSFGADVKVFGGIERVFSHNGTDPLHADNLPAWCDATAIDVVDVVVILDFNGDRPRALRELAQRFGISKTEERKELAGLIFRMIRQQAHQAAIESSAFSAGLRLGMSRCEVIATARWVAARATSKAAAA